MTNEQIKEIMALVEKYGAECWNDGRLKYGFQTDYATQQASAAIESALRAAVPAIPEVPALPPRVIECATRLVAHADFQLGGCLSDKSKAKEIPSNAIANVKARHLAQLRDALSASPQAPQPTQP